MRFRVLIACLLAPILLWAVLPMPSTGQNSAELQSKIDRARAQVQRKRGTEQLLTTDIQAYSQRIARLQGRIGGLQRRQGAIQADLDRKQAELVRLQDRLRDERARLARLRARLIIVRRQLSLRLVELYKADKPDLLTVVLNSDGFADLLERGEFIRRISDQDRRIIVLVQRAKRDAQRTEAKLDVLERRQQRITAQVLERRNEIASIKQQLIDTRVGYQGTRADKRRALGEVRGHRHAIEEDLKEMEAQQAKIQARLAGVANAAPARQGSGRFVMPANGAFTSPFGQRWGRLHAGIDIAAPVGTPLYAADSGTVAIAGWTGGYGNYTCINHGGGISTCYGHQSRIGVRVGQSVSKGQVIGAMGNTGNSTGPHLHFEVRVNGSPVDPMGYL